MRDYFEVDSVGILAGIVLPGVSCIPLIGRERYEQERVPTESDNFAAVRVFPGFGSTFFQRGQCNCRARGNFQIFALKEYSIAASRIYWFLIQNTIAI
ncbi:MAG: hypothetical protein DBP00_12190 [gamma proteobacterium symbiont of Ctena orbiculata]|nr:MAG: hypothetical protein DBP00_12190 [gamma proteobacterium symbiont of Ctena orbiculata]